MPFELPRPYWEASDTDPSGDITSLSRERPVRMEASCVITVACGKTRSARRVQQNGTLTGAVRHERAAVKQRIGKDGKAPQCAVWRPCPIWRR